ncbi:MAG TPA: hypothetical protein VK138_04555 [Acidiferrobacterales bacterium]|nr:hypothetical protein [Acidiferrobacterales bacterium]
MVVTETYMAIYMTTEISMALSTTIRMAISTAIGMATRTVTVCPHCSARYRAEQ